LKTDRIHGFLNQKKVSLKRDKRFAKGKRKGDVEKGLSTGRSRRERPGTVKVRREP